MEVELTFKGVWGILQAHASTCINNYNAKKTDSINIELTENIIELKVVI